VNAHTHPPQTRTRWRWLKKRLDFEDTADSEPSKPKRPRLAPVSGLTPCLQPLVQSPRIGPYILLEPREGGHSYRAVHRHTETEYSCKVQSYPETMAPYGNLSPHPNVAQVAEVIQGDQNVYVFFQSGRGDMHSHVRRCKRLPEREAAGLFRQMAEAVTHCHDHGIILRDLKLRKFLFVDRESVRLYPHHVLTLQGPGQDSFIHGTMCLFFCPLTNKRFVMLAPRLCAAWNFCAGPRCSRDGLWFGFAKAPDSV
uniref:Tribbles pseudokinase 3 n=1 Tax=Chelonoidis abingdonii TaxID=106734 RepID=A0A8C0IVN6_CHEAB